MRALEWRSHPKVFKACFKTWKRQQVSDTLRKFLKWCSVCLRAAWNLLLVLTRFHRCSNVSADIQTRESKSITRGRTCDLCFARCTCTLWLQGFCFRLPLFLIPSGPNDHFNRLKLCRVSGAVNTQLEVLMCCSYIHSSTSCFRVRCISWNQKGWELWCQRRGKTQWSAVWWCTSQSMSAEWPPRLSQCPSINFFHARPSTTACALSQREESAGSISVTTARSCTSSS